jgi:phage terminase small subunit
VTPKQELFVQEYLVDLNATQAAIRAGYSEETARQIGSENLSKPDIQEAIAQAMDRRSKRTRRTQDYVLNGICGIVERTQEKQPSIALRGYELLGKHLKMFTDKLEVDDQAALRSLSDHDLRQRIESKLNQLGYALQKVSDE